MQHLMVGSIYQLSLPALVESNHFPLGSKVTLKLFLFIFFSLEIISGEEAEINAEEEAEVMRWTCSSRVWSF